MLKRYIKKVFALLLAAGTFLGGSSPTVYAKKGGEGGDQVKYDLSTEEGKVLIPVTKIWDDGEDTSNRPDSINMTLTYGNYTRTFNVTKESGWTATVDVSDAPITAGTNTFVLTEKTVAGYETTETQNANVVFMPATAGEDWDRYTPCNDIDISVTGGYQKVVVAKKGNYYYFWTADPLVASERVALFNAAHTNINGFGQGNYDNAIFFSGYGTDVQLGMVVTEKNVHFDEPKTWSFMATGLFYRSSTEANVASIKNSLERVSVNGSKNWDDDYNRDGKRPDSIKVQLYADNVFHSETTVTSETVSYTHLTLPTILRV